MNLIHKILITSSMTVLGLLTFATANASTLGQTTDHTTSVNPTPTQQTWVFTPDTNQTINRIKLWTDTTYTGTQSLRILNTNGTTIATGTATILNGETTFIFPSDVNLISGTKYALHAQTFIFFGAPYNGATDYDTKGCKEYLYTPGTPLGTCGAGNTQIKADPYSVFSWTYTFSAPTLSITYPIHNNSYSDDFTHFIVDYTTNSAISGDLEVIYGLQTSSSTRSASITGQSYPGNATGTVYIAKTPGTGLQWAQAQFKNIAGTVIATSSIVNWTNQGYASTYTGNSLTYPVPYASSSNTLWLDPNATSSRWYVDCSDATGWDVFSLSGMTCWAKKGAFQIGHFLFVPQLMNDDNSAFNDALSYLKSGFPFSVMFGVLDTLQLAIEDQGYEPLYLPVNIGGATSSVEIFANDYASSLVGEDLWNTIQNLIGGALWLLLGFYIYYRANKVL